MSCHNICFDTNKCITERLKCLALLVKFLEDDIPKCFLILPRKQVLKFHGIESICMNCQHLFSKKKKKNITRVVR